ncbi:hypothetical protein BpHYR1_028321 [Brachionus plicatilis]|uniref:Uncharacterized protein n=1 Tax=Brachionus plicatilis TaxID=10195 RepID=A0A3M7R463_BRAPC|nr:hypothetical protein BpHYR1_028321 [Brachionus plicatilis]
MKKIFCRKKNLNSTDQILQKIYDDVGSNAVQRKRRLPFYDLHFCTFYKRESKVNENKIKKKKNQVKRGRRSLTKCNVIQTFYSNIKIKKRYQNNNYQENL